MSLKIFGLKLELTSITIKHKIVGETGGKDFIIAHSSANPKQVSTGIVRGAFEFQGQNVLHELMYHKVCGQL
jgi:delta 1-pyrroline-5-carboxylate dehydrogenase